jgi:hypothetical protein
VHLTSDGPISASSYITGRWSRDPAGFAAWFIWMRFGFRALVHHGSFSQREIVVGALIFAGSAGLWGAGILFNALMRRQLQDEIAEALLTLPAVDLAVFSAFAEVRVKRRGGWRLGSG